MHSIFVSDLHLCPTRPAINRIFLDFLRVPAAQAEALYILGDLFEYWAGDDDDDPFNARVLTALRELAERGVGLYLMHGNRDFLIGGRFCAAPARSDAGQPLRHADAADAWRYAVHR
jgi:UDP-2,3-diacylglucosamine hydrolase